MVEYIHGVVECSHKNDYIRRKLTLGETNIYAQQSSENSLYV